MDLFILFCNSPAHSSPLSLNRMYISWAEEEEYKGEKHLYIYFARLPIITRPQVLYSFLFSPS